MIIFTSIYFLINNSVLFTILIILFIMYFKVRSMTVLVLRITHSSPSIHFRLLPSEVFSRYL